MDTTICTSCGGRGEVERRLSDEYVELVSCSECHGSGQAPFYRVKILKKPVSGGKSIAMEAAITAVENFRKKEKK